MIEREEMRERGNEREREREELRESESERERASETERKREREEKREKEHSPRLLPVRAVGHECNRMRENVAATTAAVYALLPSLCLRRDERERAR